MLKLSLLQEMLLVSIAMSTITCAFVQKTKKFFTCSNCLSLYSLAINMICSIVFCYTFTNVIFPESLWVGLFSFLGADTIYKTLEGKIASYKDLINKNIIEVSKNNIIETDNIK